MTTTRQLQVLEIVKGTGARGAGAPVIARLIGIGPKSAGVHLDHLRTRGQVVCIGRGASARWVATEHEAEAREATRAARRLYMAEYMRNRQRPRPAPVWQRVPVSVFHLAAFA